MSMDDTVKRINELYHKSKDVGLTEEEKEEQKKLRDIYRKAVLGNLGTQLDHMSIKEPDGSIRKVKRMDDQTK